MQNTPQNTIGQILQEPNFTKDAIHIAVLPVLAKHRLHPGQPVYIEKHGETYYAHTSSSSSTTKSFVGIIDPFLAGSVFPYDRVWLFVYPNTISNMRHEWTHRELDTSDTSDTSFSKKDSNSNENKRKAEEVLRDIADEANISLEELINACRDCRDNGEFRFIGRTTPSEVLNRHCEDVFRHLSVYLDEEFPTFESPPFSCGC